MGSSLGRIRVYAVGLMQAADSVLFLGVGPVIHPTPDLVDKTTSLPLTVSWALLGGSLSFAGVFSLL